MKALESLFKIFLMLTVWLPLAILVGLFDSYYSNSHKKKPDWIDGCIDFLEWINK